jgi:Immunity protein 40
MIHGKQAWISIDMHTRGMIRWMAVIPMGMSLAHPVSRTIIITIATKKKDAQGSMKLYGKLRIIKPTGSCHIRDHIIWHILNGKLFSTYPCVWGNITAAGHPTYAQYQQLELITAVGTLLTPWGVEVDAEMIAAKSFFKGTKYSQKVIKQMNGGSGEFHSFPEIVKNFETLGIIKKIKGGDGVVREMLSIPGGYGNHEGNFEFMKELDGEINHRFFKRNWANEMKEFIEYLNTNGFPINFGSSTDLALTRRKAIAALGILTEHGEAILGGDVFVLVDNHLVPLYANWCCNQLMNETKREFSKRSIVAALDYLNNFPINEGEPYFVFVLQ